MTDSVIAFPAGQESPGNRKPVGAVVAAVKVLRYLSDSSEPVGVSTMAKETGLYPSTCFNILRTLAQENLVSFDSNSKAYSLGLGIVDFARGLLSRSGFIPSVQEKMRAIAHDGGFSMSLWRRMPGNRNVVVASASGGGVIQISIGIGERLPGYIGATGRVVAAFEPVPRAELKAAFDRLRWGGKITFSQYLKEVEETRVRGWALDDGTFRAGLATISAPVIDQSGRVRMLVAAHMFGSEFGEARQAEIAGRLIQLSQEVQRAGSITDYT
jgi:DNA-binding IclR family transcriptional regulator